jgi:hypothetical protein
MNVIRSLKRIFNLVDSYSQVEDFGRLSGHAHGVDAVDAQLQGLLTDQGQEATQMPDYSGQARSVAIERERRRRKKKQ